MPIEIERKFLAQSGPWQDAPGVSIIQGYLSSDKKRTVRVRIAGTNAFLTVKGPAFGASRLECEYPIPLADAEAMLPLCEQPVIEKVRHEFEYEGLLWEVDVFAGANTGLCVAEVELTHEDQIVPLPPWVGDEVTDDPRYHNSCLITHPYSAWS